MPARGLSMTGTGLSGGFYGGVSLAAAGEVPSNAGDCKRIPPENRDSAHLKRCAFNPDPGRLAGQDRPFR